MSWLRLALGLIREAATTEMGRDIIRDIRSGGAPPRPEARTEAAETAQWRDRVERRIAAGEKNTETLVEMLNAQDRVLVQMQQRQRIWNVALAIGIVAALALALFL